MRIIIFKPRICVVTFPDSVYLFELLYLKTLVRYWVVFFHFGNFFFFFALLRRLTSLVISLVPTWTIKDLVDSVKYLFFSTMSLLVAPGKTHYLNLSRFDGPWLLTLFNIESPIIITFFVTPSLLNFSRETSSWLDVFISLARWR